MTFSSWTNLVEVYGGLGTKYGNRWPPNVTDSRTWFAGDGGEAFVRAYESWVKVEGLHPFVQVDIPSRQMRRRKGMNQFQKTYRVPMWLIGLRTQMMESVSSPNGSAPRWWETDMKRVLDRLCAYPSGPQRVRVAQSVFSIVQLAQASGRDEVEDALTLLQALPAPKKRKK